MTTDKTGAETTVSAGDGKYTIAGDAENPAVGRDALVLPPGQLGDESVDELVDRSRAGLPDHEFRQTGSHIPVELAMQLIPARGNQVRRIDVGATFANRRRHLRRQLAVPDGQ